MQKDRASVGQLIHTINAAPAKQVFDKASDLETRTLASRQPHLVPEASDHIGLLRRDEHKVIHNGKGPAVSSEALFDLVDQITDYSMIEATMPAPTVRPPSRIAKRSFSSIAIGTISSTSTVTLSPGITISVPSGSDTMPVTSVVRK